MTAATGPILVTGAKGQLASALAKAGGEAIRCFGRPDLDFDRPDTIDHLFAAIKPTAVINAAAWTAVDAAETEEAGAYRANRDGAARLALLSADAEIPLIHLSTDYVFDGLKGAPYVETDPVNPTGVYGASKLAGEQAVLRHHPDAIILRTSWVYAATGKNFVRTMLGAARKVNELNVVADQIGCPTNAEDLADAVLAVLNGLGDQRPGARGHGLGGVYHTAGTGWTSWHGLAEAIFVAAEPYLPAVPLVTPIQTADWPTPAKRPPDSRLDCSKLRDVFGVQLPAWEDSLSRTVREILNAA